MQHLMKLLGQESGEEFQPILEVNPDHDIIKKLDTVKDGTLFEDISWLLLEQALLIEGAPPKDTTAFTRRLNNVLAKAL
jgi:molecular chaperone HtpG